jgi:hypothetical protein
MILVLAVNTAFRNLLNNDATKYSRHGVSCTLQTMINKLQMELNYNLRTRSVVKYVCGFHTVCHIIKVLVF